MERFNVWNKNSFDTTKHNPLAKMNGFADLFFPANAHDEMINHINALYGDDITILGDYNGFKCKSYTDDDIYDVHDALLLGIFNPMWCGGVSLFIYKGKLSPRKHVDPEYVAANSVGWCGKCHSYCYGDCES